MRVGLAFTLLVVGCARPTVMSEPERVAVVEPIVVERPSFFAGVDRAVAAVDARRDAPRADQQAFGPATTPRVEAPSELAERQVEPEATPRATAFEVERGGNRVAIVERSAAPKLSRFEAESLARRCERRPTRWAREQCMAGK